MLAGMGGGGGGESSTHGREGDVGLARRLRRGETAEDAGERVGGHGGEGDRDRDRERKDGVVDEVVC